MACGRGGRSRNDGPFGLPMAGRSRAGPPSPCGGARHDAPACAARRAAPDGHGHRLLVARMPARSGGLSSAAGLPWSPLRFKGILLHDDARQLRRRRVGRIPNLYRQAARYFCCRAPPLTSPRTQRRLCSSGAPAESAGDLCKKDQRQTTMRLSRLMQKILGCTFTIAARARQAVAHFDCGGLSGIGRPRLLARFCASL